jgi:hypothetical protein
MAGDKIWFYHFLPATKHQSHLTQEMKPKALPLGTADCLSQGDAIKSRCCRKTMQVLRHALCDTHPGKKNMLLPQDSARLNSAQLYVQMIYKNVCEHFRPLRVRI